MPASTPKDRIDVLIAGMGFAGISCARVLADAGYRVHLVDRRPHIGGNAFDTVDAHGIQVHPYGPHIFHTNLTRVVRFLSRFTQWRPYEHRVLAKVGEQLVPFPINRTTINRLYGLELDEAGAREFLDKVREPGTVVGNSKDFVLSRVGRDLCEKFYSGYTRKHWGLELDELAPGVAGRIPVRTSDDDRYFSCRFQAMPAAGYTRMFEAMLDHPLISHEVGTSLESARRAIAFRHLIHTGCIDEYFDIRFGRLPYRSVVFELEHRPAGGLVLPATTINFPNDFAFTRVTEFRQLTGQDHLGTTLMREYPSAQGEPFYPVPTAGNRALYQRYKALARKLPEVTFLGRLAQYQYFNMDQAVGASLAVASRLVERLR